MKNHLKHAIVSKPKGGKFHTLEWAVIGAPCPEIKSLSLAITKHLKENFKIGFVDQKHQLDPANKIPFHVHQVDELSHYTLDFHREKPLFDSRSAYLSCDAVLVNGNHFKADRQIVLIHEKKKDSLQRKLERLTNIEMVILFPGNNQPYSFVQELIGESTPIFQIHQITEIAEFITKEVLKDIPPLHGLVLMGGKSTRMGQDKALLSYRGLPQFQYLHDLLNEICDEVSLSVRSTDSYKVGLRVQPDTFLGLGPYGGILSFFRNNQTSALLTVPTDAPLIDKSLISELISHRDPTKLATCFLNPETGFPEPLITIWEPRAYPVLLHYLYLGYSCPRKVLINEEVRVITCSWPEKLKNANTPEEREKLKKLLPEV